MADAHLSSALAPSSSQPPPPSPAGDALTQWETSFHHDVVSIRHLVDLHTRPADSKLRDALEPILSSLSSRLSQAERAADQLQAHLDEENPLLEQATQSNAALATQTGRLHDIRERLPQHLKDVLQQHLDGQSTAPSPAPSPASSLDNGSTDVLESLVDNEGGSDGSVRRQAPISKGKANRKSKQPSAHISSKKPPPLPKGRTPRGDNSASAATPTPTARGTPSPSTATPDRKAVAKHSVSVYTVTQEELTSAPQYVKGRITLAALTAVSARLSQIASAKYAILRRPISALTSTEITQSQSFRDAQCDETQGHMFLTDTEIKKFGEYRLDFTVKAAINVLRHVGALKEVSGKNRARVFIINGAEE